MILTIEQPAPVPHSCHPTDGKHLPLRTPALLALTLLALALATCDSAPPSTGTATAEEIAQATIDTSVAVAVTAQLGTSTSSPMQTPMPTPSPTATSSRASNVVPQPRPLLIPTLRPTPTPTPLLVPTPHPTPMPTPLLTPTLGPTPTPTPLLTSTPRPTPTPTSGERLAFEHLSQIIPWFADPPDEWHTKAVTALVKTGARDRRLGEAVARLPWVNDGIRVDEIRMIWYVRDRAYADPTYRVVQNRYWLQAGPSQVDLRELHLEMLVLIAGAAKRNPALAQSLQELPQIAGSVLGDGGMGQDWVRIADRSVEAALTAAAFANHNASAGRPLLFALRLLATEGRTPEQFDQLVAAPWFVDGLDDVEATLVVALGEAFRDPELFDDLLRTGVTPTP